MQRPVFRAILLVFTLLTTLAITGFSQDRTSSHDINWMTFEDAVKASEKNPRKILIDVYTDWCGWCKKLDNITYKDPELVQYVNKHYYAVKLDAEMKDTVHFKNHIFINENPTVKRSSHQLAISLLDRQMSYPTTVILDEGFNRPTPPLKGFMDAKTLLPVLRFFGDNIYKDTTWEDYQKQLTSTP